MRLPVAIFSAILICGVVIIAISFPRLIVSPFSTSRGDNPVSVPDLTSSELTDDSNVASASLAHSEYHSPGFLPYDKRWRSCAIRYSVPIVLGFGWWFQKLHQNRTLVISDDKNNSAISCLLSFTQGALVSPGNLLDGSLHDVVIVAYALESSSRPWEDLQNYARLVNKGGHLVMLSLFFWPERGVHDYFRFLPSGLSNMAEWAGCRKLEFSDGWGSWDFWTRMAKHGPEDTDNQGVDEFTEGREVNLGGKLYKSDGENYFVTWAVMGMCGVTKQWSSQLLSAGVPWPPNEQQKLASFEGHIFETGRYNFEPCKGSYGRIAAHHAIEQWLVTSEVSKRAHTDLLNVSPPVGGLECWGRHFNKQNTRFVITHWNKGQHEICEGLPFADDSFDFVIMQMVIEHSVFVWQCYREVHRVLKKGGIFISTNPVKFRRHPLGGSQKANQRLKEKGYAYPDNYRVLPAGNRALSLWAGFSKIHQSSGWGMKRFFAEPSFDIPKVKTHMTNDPTSGIGDPYVVTAWLIAEK
ncbi:hypothetical protein FOZ63_000022 [Perkinsus olseni]|uniref:Methyltransferase type 11 domain-containing protein n=1 Tax=Perkinsus olseni TaxID=32597 RepID=A0A7J6TWU0_PEROL|nr:hypothetical protein FOZ63_000022 [Perkinsus olseni]